MSCTTHYGGDTLVHRLDPRPRIIVTMAFSVLIAVSGDSGVLCAGLLAGLALVFLSRLPLGHMAKRIGRLNLFMCVLFLLVPATFPGRTAFKLATIRFSMEGIVWSAAITLKANAIVLVFISLMGTVEPMTLGHAFHHLRTPAKLAHLFMFTLRYLDLLHNEYQTLLRAMKARGFRPRMRLHTYRSYAYLVAMLLVRSLERSERVMAAMKCRGFKGEFHVIHHFRFHFRDAVFCAVSAVIIVTLAVASFTGSWRIW